MTKSWRFFFIRKLSKKFQIYVTYCSQCQFNRIVKYSSYKVLRFIQLLIVLFYIVIINFILTLSTIMKNEFDVVLTIICKFIKRILFVSNKNNYFAKQWVNVFLLIVLKHDWNVLRVIISNKNNKFMSIFWIDLFRRLNTKLLIFTIYHSQTND